MKFQGDELPYQNALLRGCVRDIGDKNKVMKIFSNPLINRNHLET